MESILEAEEALMRFGCVVVVVISRCIEYKRIEQSEFLLLVGRSRGLNLRPSLLSALAAVVDQIAVVLAADKERERVNE